MRKTIIRKQNIENRIIPYDLEKTIAAVLNVNIEEVKFNA